MSACCVAHLPIDESEIIMYPDWYLYPLPKAVLRTDITESVVELVVLMVKA
jgi:hypothetical protein